MAEKWDFWRTIGSFQDQFWNFKQCFVWKQWRWFESWHLHPGRTDLPKIIIYWLQEGRGQKDSNTRGYQPKVMPSLYRTASLSATYPGNLPRFWNKRQDSYAPTPFFQVTWTFLCSLNISRSRSACTQQWKAGSPSGARPPLQPTASASCCCCCRCYVCLWSSEAPPRLIKLKPPPKHGQMPTYLQI